MTHYIYELKFLETNRIYIGQTKYPETRIAQHRLKPSGSVLNYCRENNDWKFSSEIVFKSQDKSVIDVLEKRLIKSTRCINRIKRIRKKPLITNYQRVYELVKSMDGAKIYRHDFIKLHNIKHNTLKSSLNRLVRNGLIQLTEYRAGPKGYSSYKVTPLNTGVY